MYLSTGQEGPSKGQNPQKSHNVAECVSRDDSAFPRRGGAVQGSPRRARLPPGLRRTSVACACALRVSRPRLVELLVAANQNLMSIFHITAHGLG